MLKVKNNKNIDRLRKKLIRAKKEYSKKEEAEKINNTRRKKAIWE